MSHMRSTHAEELTGQEHNVGEWSDVHIDKQFSIIITLYISIYI
jgi:hypothetical protein